MRASLLLFLIVSLSCKPSNKIGELVGVPKERPLENTFWVLTEINGSTVVDRAKPPFIQLNPAENKILGFGGCNQLGGQYALSGKKITFKTISTRMFCQDVMEIETQFIQALENSKEFHIDEHILSLRMDKKILLVFRAETKSQN